MRAPGSQCGNSGPRAASSTRSGRRANARRLVGSRARNLPDARPTSGARRRSRARAAVRTPCDVGRAHFVGAGCPRGARALGCGPRGEHRVVEEPVQRVGVLGSEQVARHASPRGGGIIEPVGDHAVLVENARGGGRGNSGGGDGLWGKVRSWEALNNAGDETSARHYNRAAATLTKENPNRRIPGILRVSRAAARRTATRGGVLRPLQRGQVVAHQYAAGPRGVSRAFPRPLEKPARRITSLINKGSCWSTCPATATPRYRNRRSNGCAEIARAVPRCRRPQECRGAVDRRAPSSHRARPRNRWQVSSIRDTRCASYSPSRTRCPSQRRRRPSRARFPGTSVGTWAWCRFRAFPARASTSCGPGSRSSAR